MGNARDPHAPHVAVLGGGLAGLSAASILCTRGFLVTLLEARPRLGGRASSFVDRVTGEEVDNCQHVSMGCCTNLADFCQRVGIGRFFRRDRTLHFIGPDGRQSDLSPSMLPAPLHLAPQFLRLRFLNPGSKIAIGSGMARLARLHREVRDRGGPFSDWLDRHHQPAQAKQLFWSTVLTSALGEECEKIDPVYARKVFVDGFLANRCGSEILLPTAPLETLYGRRLTDWLTGHGVEIRLGCAVRGLRVCGNRIEGLDLREGRNLQADVYLATVPFDRLLGLLPQELVDREPYFGRIRELQSAPITGVHLWFDRPITPLPHAILIGRTSQWLFNRSALWASAEADAGMSLPNSKRFYYQVVISASHALADVSHNELTDRVVQELTEIWPAARSARLLHSRVVTERTAVFSVRPGVDAIRPPQQSPVENLWLAGDWTGTGWPATMEGAVRSGYLAAESILSRYAKKEKILQPDLPVGFLARLLFARV